MGCSASTIAVIPTSPEAPPSVAVQADAISCLPSRLPSQSQHLNFLDYVNSSSTVVPPRSRQNGSSSSSPVVANMSRHASLTMCSPTMQWNDGMAVMQSSTPGGPLLDDMLASSQLVMEPIMLHHRRTSKTSITSPSIRSPLEDFAVATARHLSTGDFYRGIPVNSINEDHNAQTTTPDVTPTAIAAALVAATSSTGAFAVPQSHHLRGEGQKTQQQQQLQMPSSSTADSSTLLLPPATSGGAFSDDDGSIVQTHTQLPMVLPIASFHANSSNQQQPQLPQIQSHSQQQQQQQTPPLHRQSSFGNYVFPTAYAFPSTTTPRPSAANHPFHRRSVTFEPTNNDDLDSAGSPSAHSSATGAAIGFVRRRVPSMSLNEAEESPRFYQPLPITTPAAAVIAESPRGGRKPQLRLALAAIPFKSPGEGSALRTSPTASSSDAVTGGRTATGRAQVPPSQRFRLATASGASGSATRRVSIGASSSVGDASARSLVLEPNGGPAAQLFPVYRNRFDSLSRRSGMESSSGGGPQSDQPEDNVWAMNEDGDGDGGFMLRIPELETGNSARSMPEVAELPLYFTEDE
ncbi:Hypothetical protein, putative [Bodo saltans]|uniref:Uncharacterized protein n=1 Tax=Bodo saltans TaxID=75058 RepID=A0A0S4KFF8_BODSA|nr:Hypothetical protein, putative [Bodo saltans]|eukprot:CUI14312.1 Hypothetical protein, putative [Bodo saltans]